MAFLRANSVYLLFASESPKILQGCRRLPWERLELHLGSFFWGLNSDSWDFLTNTAQTQQAATLGLQQPWEEGVGLRQEDNMNREVGFPSLAQCLLCTLQLTPHQLGGGEETALYWRHMSLMENLALTWPKEDRNLSGRLCRAEWNPQTNSCTPSTFWFCWKNLKGSIVNQPNVV